MRESAPRFGFSVSPQEYLAHKKHRPPSQSASHLATGWEQLVGQRRQKQEKSEEQEEENNERDDKQEKEKRGGRKEKKEREEKEEREETEVPSRASLSRAVAPLSEEGGRASTKTIDKILERRSQFEAGRARDRQHSESANTPCLQAPKAEISDSLVLERGSRLSRAAL